MEVGDYREALQTLEVIAAIHPEDSWVPLYREMVQSRLGSKDLKPHLSEDRLSRLRERLKEEEKEQDKKARQAKVLKRTIKREQDKWDEALKKKREAQERAKIASERESLRKRKEKARQLTDKEKAHRRQQREESHQKRVQAVSDEPVLPVVPLEPKAPEIVQQPGEQRVELAPIRVPTREREPQGSRELVETGVVEINALHMSVFPDRNIAIAKGDVEVLYGGTRLTCEQLTLFTDTHDAYAEGDVRIMDGDTLFRAEMAQFNLDTKKGRFLEGTVSSSPWHQHGRWFEQITEDVYRVNPGYVTSCDHEPPHFKFASRESTVFSAEGRARTSHTALIIDRLPILYTPWFLFSNSQSPFYIRPGKRNPWGQYALMGYRYELAGLPGKAQHEGTLKMDWRRHFGWGVGMDHKIDSQEWGEGLLKLYYNDLKNRRERNAGLPKGADEKRYRLLWRHLWQPYPNTRVITDVQEFGDENFRKDLLFYEEFTSEATPESLISMVTSTPNYSITAAVRKRLNRFQGVTEELPSVEFELPERPIGDSWLFTDTTASVSSLNTKNANSDEDTDVVRVGWRQQLRYALNWFRPVEVTPSVQVRQTYYTKDIQGATREGKRDLISGQFSTGVDASLKLFRIFDVATNAFGLGINQLRHVLTPTIAYSYFHEPTVPNSLLAFSTASRPSNRVTLELENKLQTKRPSGDVMRSVDLMRWIISLPYDFHGSGNDAGGRLSNWQFDLEVYPWPWMRFESNWTRQSHTTVGVDSQTPIFNTDLVIVGGRPDASAINAPSLQALKPIGTGVENVDVLSFLPIEEWFLGMGHRHTHNSKTESVLQFDWRLSDKWQIGTFHRFTWKEVAEGVKRFGNMREYQYSLKRDLHDWVGELVWRVDREFGEEIFFNITLKAFPQMPFELADSYHQPKDRSQSSPFSPVKRF